MQANLDFRPAAGDAPAWASAAWTRWTAEVDAAAISVAADPATEALRRDRELALRRGFCFLTLLTSEEFLPGVLVLHQSLLRVRARYHLCVAVAGPRVPESLVRFLSELGMWIISLKVPSAHEMSSFLGRHGSCNALNVDSGAFVVNVEELELFGLGSGPVRVVAPIGESEGGFSEDEDIMWPPLRYDSLTFHKFVFLDADTLVLRNVDDLFERPSGTAFLADAEEVNIGVYVLETDARRRWALQRRLREELLHGRSIWGADQRVLSAYAHAAGVAAYYLKNISLRLSQSDNAFAEGLDKASLRQGLFLPAQQRFGYHSRASQQRHWRCFNGGFDFCCQHSAEIRRSPVPAHDIDTSCTQEGTNHRVCCEIPGALGSKNLVRVVHFVLAKPWRVENSSSVFHEGRRLGMRARRAYGLWQDAAVEAIPQQLRLLDAFDRHGSVARDRLAAGDVVASDAPLLHWTLNG
eukprot:TRINITY_DN15263_c0_g1_i3.p1 TRINITY_DN15263_c0_g1~~TRINITY_DN15263_c0_g1_i3.p1  ORF type:complete len:466 (-),score=94.16 TRINITY_DN15263_c0_g1_i3:325-1722(-)